MYARACPSDIVGVRYRYVVCVEMCHVWDGRMYAWQDIECSPRIIYMYEYNQALVCGKNHQRRNEKKNASIEWGGGLATDDSPTHPGGGSCEDETCSVGTEQVSSGKSA